MRYRLDILEREKISLFDIQKVISQMRPLDGAKEFLDWLKSVGRVVILSDTFEQFAKPLMAQLDYPTLFCHSLEVDSKGKITGYKLRLNDQKRKAVEAFRGLNFEVIASGDSYNDLSMLRSANAAVLYKPTADLPVAQNYAELKTQFEKFIK